MPSRTLEIILITLILFFTYSFSIHFFQEIISKNSLENEIMNYFSNNFLLCITITNTSYGSFGCYISFENKNIQVLSGGEYFAIKSGNSYFHSNINLYSLFSKKIYVISNNYFYLRNNIKNISI